MCFDRLSYSCLVLSHGGLHVIKSSSKLDYGAA